MNDRIRLSLIRISVVPVTIFMLLFAVIAVRGSDGSRFYEND